MDIKKCQLFVITAETQNISKTAEITGYTQSAVSHALKNLEAEVGMKLLHRDRYGVHLTPIGRDILPYIRRFVNENDVLERFVYELKGIEIGTLSIGTYKSISINWLPDILNQFREFHPDINIQIKEGGATEIERWMADAEVDLGMLSKRINSTYDFFYLQKDELKAVLPPDDAFSSYTAIPLESFQQRPYIQSEIGVDIDIQPLLDKYNIKPNVRFSAMDDHTIISMVNKQMGVSILPQLTVNGYPNNCEIRSLSPASYRYLGIAVPNYKKSSPLAKTFIKFVQDYFARKVLK